MSAASGAAVVRSVALVLVAAMLAVEPAPALAQGPDEPGPPPKTAPQAPRTQPPARQPPTRQPLMPGVTGLPLVVAQVILLQRGLVAQVQSSPSSQAQGLVTAQAPAAGQPIEPGGAVRLWVSAGPRPVAPPRPAPLPPRPASPPQVQPQPFQPQPLKPQPFRPQPIRPAPVASPPPSWRPSRPTPVAPRASPTPALPTAAPTLSATPTSPSVPASELPPSAPTPAAPSGAGNLLGWLALAALAALVAIAAAVAALALRARLRSAALVGAHVPFSVAASLTGGVKSAASDVRPSAAPTISVGWTIHLAPPRIEGLGVQEPGA